MESIICLPKSRSKNVTRDSRNVLDLSLLSLFEYNPPPSLLFNFFSISHYVGLSLSDLYRND